MHDARFRKVHIVTQRLKVAYGSCRHVECLKRVSLNCRQRDCRESCARSTVAQSVLLGAIERTLKRSFALTDGVYCRPKIRQFAQER